MYPDPYPDELRAMLQPGKCIRIPPHYNPHTRNALLYIRAIVDDDNIVYRTWSKHKQRWIYGIEWSYMFWLWWKDGVITPVTPRRPSCSDTD